MLGVAPASVAGPGPGPAAGQSVAAVLRTLTAGPTPVAGSPVGAGPGVGPTLAGAVGVLGRQLSRDWAFVLDSLDYLLGGTLLTVGLTLSSVLLGFVVGFPAGAAETYGRPRTRAVVGTAGVVLRGTPLLVILTFLFFGVFSVRLPAVGTPVGPVGGAQLGYLAGLVPFVGKAFVAATLGLGLRSAAYQAQVFRGAFRSVAGGQMEAARAVGLSRVAAIRHVVVPQALRRSVPGIQNEVTIVLKDTSIAFAIGIAELLTRSFNLFTQSGRTTAITEIILTASLIYFVLTLTANRTLDAVRNRYRVPTGEDR